MDKLTKLDVDAVLKGKYPAKSHAKRVAKYLLANGKSKDSILYLEGQKTRMLEDNDEAAPFRQRRYFYYLSGCDVPDSYLTYDIRTEQLTLFIPPIDPDSVIWSGLPLQPAEALKIYDVDEVKTSDELNASLAHLASSAASPSTVHAIPDQVSDHITFLPFQDTDFSLIKRAIEDTRVVKSEYEIALIRRANIISTKAHIEVLKNVSTAASERELYAIFLATCIANAGEHQAYHPIVASGASAATLHYQKNTADLHHEDSAKKLNLLLDAGCEYSCYASDITRTFPINGTFTPDSLTLYNTVLEMQEQSLRMLKAGVKWDDVHVLAHRIAIKGLLKMGILQGHEEEIFEKRVSVAFFPHGLGHYLGMDTHDTGGNPNYEDEDSMFRYLRVRGTVPAGSVVTVEPGIYFCRFIIEPYLKDPATAPYINVERLNDFWDVGGVRIEDNILITSDGYENLTDTPKGVEEVGKIIKGGN